MKNLIKIKNFALIIQEFKKLINYLDNKIFFLSMENMIRNDLNRIVDQISQSLLDSLDLNLDKQFLQ